MRYLALGVALAAIPASAMGQQSNWQLGPGPSDPDLIQAVVENDAGAKVVLRCEKAGKYNVYALFVSPEKLSDATVGRWEVRPVTMRYDDGKPFKDSWRFAQTFAYGFEEISNRTVSRFVEKLADASKLEFRLEPYRSPILQYEFDVTGAKEALAQVYESCEDKSPIK